MPREIPVTLDSVSIPTIELKVRIIHSRNSHIFVSVVTGWPVPGWINIRLWEFAA